MMNKHGKHICNALKQVRIDIARANGINYAPRECHHEGDCAGTCPACESEMRYLEREIARRRSLGKSALVAGVSMGLSSLSAMASTSSPSVPMMSGDHPASQLSDTTEVFQVLGRINETVPQFPGGEAALMRYFHANFKYPPEVAETCFQGRVVVTFLIDKTGRVAEVKVLRSIHDFPCKGYIDAHKNMGNPIPEDELWELFYQCLAGVYYIHRNNLKGVATDIDGHFKLDVPKDSKIKVTYIGYEDAVVTASDGMTITLKPSDNVLLGEVCVVVNSRAKNAQYPGGDKALQKFIIKNFICPDDVTGREYVMVEVDVDKKGNVSNPRVLNELGTPFEKEALRVAGLIRKIKPARDVKGKKTDSTFSISFDSADWTD